MKNNLEQIIKDKGIKKTWLAEQAGVNRNTISGLIKGSTPSLPLAYRIANVLDMSVQDIWSPPTK